jgi:hypothetical protein
LRHFCNYTELYPKSWVNGLKEEIKKKEVLAAKFVVITLDEMLAVQAIS